MAFLLILAESISNGQVLRHWLQPIVAAVVPGLVQLDAAPSTVHLDPASLGVYVLLHHGTCLSGIIIMHQHYAIVDTWLLS